MNVLDDSKPLNIVALPDYKPGKDILSELQLAQLEQLRVSDMQYQAELEEAGNDEGAINLAEEGLLKRFCEQADIPIPRMPRTVEIEYARSRGINPDYTLQIAAPDMGSSSQQNKIELQTLFFPEKYERRLSRVRDDARTALQELGINMLHVALGFLEWYESESSEKMYLSPLLLIPVSIERTTERQQYAYNLAGLGEDAMPNVTLAERLRTDFSILLPDFNADEPLDVLLSKNSGRNSLSVEMEVENIRYARNV